MLLFPSAIRMVCSYFWVDLVDSNVDTRNPFHVAFEAGTNRPRPCLHTKYSRSSTVPEWSGASGSSWTLLANSSSTPTYCPAPRCVIPQNVTVPITDPPDLWIITLLPTPNFPPMAAPLAPLPPERGRSGLLLAWGLMGDGDTLRVFLLFLSDPIKVGVAPGKLVSERVWCWSTGWKSSPAERGRSRLLPVAVAWVGDGDVASVGRGDTEARSSALLRFSALHSTSTLLPAVMRQKGLWVGVSPGLRDDATPVILVWDATESRHTSESSTPRDALEIFTFCWSTFRACATGYDVNGCA